MKRAYDGSDSSIGRSVSSSSTRRRRNAWNESYHSRSQCVCGTIATMMGERSFIPSSSLSSDPAVADAGFGEDQPGTGGVVAELLAELADVHPQVVALRAVTRSPHLAQEVLL